MSIVIDNSPAKVSKNEDKTIKKNNITKSSQKMNESILNELN